MPTHEQAPWEGDRRRDEYWRQLEEQHRRLRLALVIVFVALGLLAVYAGVAVGLLGK